MPINLSSTAPSAPTGKKDIHWAKDTSVTPPNISGYFDLDVAVTNVNASGTTAIAAVLTSERVTASSPVADITRTLPAATGSNSHVRVKKIDSASYSVLVTAAGTDMIDGLSVYALVNRYQFVELCDAAPGVWDIVGLN